VTETVARTQAVPVDAPAAPRFGVGERRKRFDALGRVRGTIRYTGDEPVAAGTAFVGVHRSTLPHARIVDIDTAAALRIDGVLGVITGQDVYEALGERVYTGPAFSDQPCMAVGSRLAGLEHELFVRRQDFHRVGHRLEIVQQRHGRAGALRDLVRVDDPRVIGQARDTADHRARHAQRDRLDRRHAADVAREGVELIVERGEVGG